MSSIHALQSSTTSRKLLESVRCLRPLLCEALKASGCATIDIDDADQAEKGEGLQSEDARSIETSHSSDQRHDQYMREDGHAGLHSTSSFHGHNIDLIVKSEKGGHMPEDLHVQHCNPWHVASQSHNLVIDGVHSTFVDGYGQYSDALNMNGYDKCATAEYGHHGNVYPKEFEHHGDALQHGNWIHGDDHLYSQGHHHWHGDHHDADRYGHEHEDGSFANPIFMGTDNLPLFPDHSSELIGVQTHQKETLQMSFWNSLSPKRESSVNVKPYNPLSYTQYPQANNYLLDHQHIQAYHDYHSQQHIPSETITFANSVLLEIPERLNHEGAEGTATSNNSNKGVQVQDLYGYSTNNLTIHEVHGGHPDNCREAPRLSKPHKRKKKLPKAMSEQLEPVDESEGTEEGVKTCRPKDKPTMSTASLMCERRRRKKWNDALYSLRALVPIVSKMDKLSIIGDTLTYLQQLRDRVENLQNDVSCLQAEKEDLARSQEGLFTCISEGEKSCTDSPKYKIFEINVRLVDVEQKTYHLCIRCEREDRVVLELTRALEALNFDMLNASIGATNGNQIIYTVVLKVEIADVLTSDSLKESILNSATMYGFHL